MWLQQPLVNVAAIDRRLNAVAALTDNTVGRQELRLALTGMGDMERLMSRIVYGTAGARDLVNLRAALEHLPEIKRCLVPFRTGALGKLDEQLETLEDISGRIAAVLVDEPPFSVREGGMIREGYDDEVDRLRGILSGGKGFIAQLEAREKEKTGIRTLKVGYNKVFGYYIEVSNSFKDQVPADYIRKQTLVNGERYITQELKDLEHEVLTAHDRDAALEYDLFAALRTEAAGQVTRVQLAASLIAQLDTLCAFAEVAAQNHYCRPEVDESGVIEITAGRHPVVEKVRGDAFFVPNDTHMGAKEDRVAIITGPNMAGKSTYMRQVALIVLMAQVGCFVPAQRAHIGVVDRIFTRIGASDDLAAGQSTFMVEMTEVSELLRCATKNSLLILDEIGRGTSTFDGMSIARAVLEHCAGKLKAKTLFATHYHELTTLEQELPNVRNYNVAVHARGEDIVFLRKIVPGGADRSYGIEVAKLAGLPEAVVSRARKILRQLEEEDPQLQNDFRDPELDDYRAGSFYWAIRRAAQYEGIYADAATADAYWQSVADAINAACDNGTLPARSGRRSATSQPIRAQYVLPAIQEAAKSALWALTFQDCPAYYQTLRSIGTTEDVAQWSAYLHCNFNNAAEAGKDTPYYAPLQKLAYRALGVLCCVYAVLLPLAFVWAAVRHLCALPMVLRRRTAWAALPWLLLFGLLAMAALRCGMIAFVEVSSFGIGTSTMYLSTVHPLLLLYTYGCLICYRNKGVITE